MIGICTVIVKSSLALSLIAGISATHSVSWYDKQSQISEHVLDRTACGMLARTQQADTGALLSVNTSPDQKLAILTKAKLNAQRNAEALSLHCKHSPRVPTDKQNECTLVR